MVDLEFLHILTLSIFSPGLVGDGACIFPSLIPGYTFCTLYFFHSTAVSSELVILIHGLTGLEHVHTFLQILRIWISVHCILCEVYIYTYRRTP